MKTGELADQVASSAGFISQVAKPLVDAGWLRSDPGPSRGYALEVDSGSFGNCVVFGQAACWYSLFGLLRKADLTSRSVKPLAISGCLNRMVRGVVLLMVC